jgi:hypothetical protein
MRILHRILLGALVGAVACSSAADPAGPSTPLVTPPVPTPSTPTLGVALTDSLLALAPGGGADVGVLITRGGGLVGAVDLTTDALPNGVSVSFAPATVGAGATSSRLTVHVAPGVVAPATIPVVVRAHASGAADRLVTFAIVVAAAADASKQPYAAPSGTPYTLPAGVTVTMQGLDGTLEPTDPAAKKQPCYGKPVLNASSGYVAICLRVTNANADPTGAPIRIVFPPGLLFLSQSVTTQGGLLVWDVTISVPPKTTAEYVLMLYCATPAAHTSTAADTYTFGPVPQHPLAQEMIAMLSGRSAVTHDDHGLVQGMVWLVAANGDRPEAVRPLLQMSASGLPGR